MGKFIKLFHESKVSTVEIDPKLHEGISDLREFILKKFQEQYKQTLGQDKDLCIKFVIDRYLKEKLYRKKMGVVIKWSEENHSIFKEKAQLIDDTLFFTILLYREYNMSKLRIDLSHELTHLNQQILSVHLGKSNIVFKSNDMIVNNNENDLFKSTMNVYSDLPAEQDAYLDGILRSIKDGSVFQNSIDFLYEIKFLKNLNSKKFIQKAYLYGLTNLQIKNFKEYLERKALEKYDNVQKTNKRFHDTQKSMSLILLEVIIKETTKWFSVLNIFGVSKDKILNRLNLLVNTFIRNNPDKKENIQELMNEI
jgi:hypothetical protein